MWFQLDLGNSKRAEKRANKVKKAALIKRMKSSILSKVPVVKPLPLWAGFLVFGGLTLIGLQMGLTIATYIFFGIATLTGLVAISETNRWVRYVFTKSNKFIDLSLFAFTIWATASLGVTMVAALTFAGLGVTLVYNPWLRLREKLRKLNK